MKRKLNFGRMLLAGLATLSLLTVLTVPVQAGNISWRSNLRQAAAESKKLQKPLLLEFTASWCGYCRKMKLTTFRDKDVCRQVNGCFVPVRINADKNRELMKAVNVEFLPTTVVVSPQLVVLKRIQGFRTALQYRQQLGGLCRMAKHETAGKPVSRGRNIKPPIPVSKKKPSVSAFRGHCLVSLLDDQKIRRGTSRFTSRYRGVTLSFSSAAYRDRFNANPMKYWPVADGNCVVTAAENQGTKAGNPKFSAIYKQRLWFFATAERRGQFAQKPGSFPATTK